MILGALVRDDERDLALGGVRLGQVDEHVGGIGLAQADRDRRRAGGHHVEVLVHAHRVVTVQVADHGVVARRHVDREHQRGARGHRRVAGLPDVGDALGVFVEAVRLAFEPDDREVRGHGVGLKDHELVILGSLVRDDERDLALGGVRLGQVDEHVGGIRLAQADRDRRRAGGHHVEVLVHAHRVVTVQVADHGVVARRHVDREHERGARGHRRIAGLPDVGDALGVFVEAVRLAFEPDDREVRGHGVGLKDHELVILGALVRDDERDLALGGVRLGQVDEHVGGIRLAQADRDRRRAGGHHVEVLVHAHRVVTREVAHDRRSGREPDRGTASSWCRASCRRSRPRS